MWPSPSFSWTFLIVNPGRLRIACVQNACIHRYKCQAPAHRRPKACSDWILLQLQKITVCYNMTITIVKSLARWNFFVKLFRETVSWHAGLTNNFNVEWHGRLHVQFYEVFFKFAMHLNLITCAKKSDVCRCVFFPVFFLFFLREGGGGLPLGFLRLIAYDFWFAISRRLEL